MRCLLLIVLVGLWLASPYGAVPLSAQSAPLAPDTVPPCDHDIYGVCDTVKFFLCPCTDSTKFRIRVWLWNDEPVREILGPSAIFSIGTFFPHYDSVSYRASRPELLPWFRLPLIGYMNFVSPHTFDHTMDADVLTPPTVGRRTSIRRLVFPARPGGGVLVELKLGERNPYSLSASSRASL